MHVYLLCPGKNTYAYSFIFVETIFNFYWTYKKLYLNINQIILIIFHTFSFSSSDENLEMVPYKSSSYLKRTRPAFSLGGTMWHTTTRTRVQYIVHCTVPEHSVLPAYVLYTV